MGDCFHLLHTMQYDIQYIMQTVQDNGIECNDRTHCVAVNMDMVSVHADTRTSGWLFLSRRSS